MVAYYSGDNSSTASTVWYSWASDTTGSSASYYQNDVYRHWVSTASCSSTLSGEVWSTWVWAKYIPPAESDCPTRKQTPEEAEALAEAARKREKELTAEVAKAKAIREKAEERANELLLSVLDDKQKADYEKTKEFEVQAADGKRYRLKRGWAGNIVELDDLGRAIARLCIHPLEKIPPEDNLIAQKFMIETDPKKFREVANRSPLAV